jgi:hypothetical protein
MEKSDIFIETNNGSTLSFREYAIGDDVTVKSTERFNQSLNLIENITDSFVNKIDSLQNAPAEFEVEFGIVFKADLGAIVAKTSAEANFKITLKWKRN